jgi:cyanate lyase
MIRHDMTEKIVTQEEFGDGILSAIDLRMDISREPDPQGDRVKISLSAYSGPIQPLIP